jgi:hypothetical protein
MMSGDLAPFTDYATFLHSRQLEHVIHRIDPTQPGMPEHKSISVEPSSAAGLEVILETLKESDDTALRVTLLSRLERFGEGHEAEIGKMLESAGVEVAMGLLRVLEVLGTPAAKEAFDRAIKNPNAIVRIVALGQVGANLRRDGELGALLNGPDPQTRFDALVSIEKYKIVPAIGALVTRIAAPAFDKLPIEERRQAFSALGALDATRAESIAVEVLGKPRDAATHQVAIELLGSVGESPEGRLALEAATAGAGAIASALAIIALASFDARTSVGA